MRGRAGRVAHPRDLLRRSGAVGLEPRLHRGSGYEWLTGRRGAMVKPEPLQNETVLALTEARTTLQVLSFVDRDQDVALGQAVTETASTPSTSPGSLGRAGRRRADRAGLISG